MSGNDGRKVAVYFDYWVWVKLARIALGRSGDAEDVAVLQAVQDARDRGVIFPLSTAHYLELSSVTNERQRRELAAFMGGISFCRTLCSRVTLARHQMLLAMHEQFGRPAFRPPVPRAYGIGASWAFAGHETPFQLREGNNAIPTPDALIPTLRGGHQYAELRILEGARADEVDRLRRHGYRPEAAHEATDSRIEWEHVLERILSENPRISRNELRVRVQARELIHEYLETFTTLMAEYGLNLHRALGSDPRIPGSGRDNIVKLMDRIPAIQIATDLKVEVFRDTTLRWNRNYLFDIDALSIAIPYCRIVVPDKQMSNFLTRSRTSERHQVTVVRSFRDIRDALRSLVDDVAKPEGDVTGWDALYPGSGWDPLDLDTATGK